MNLEFFVKDQQITRKGFQPVVADTTGFYTFSIAFDQAWDDLVKVVVLQNGGETAQMIYTGQTWLPDNVNKRGNLYLACHGYREAGDSTAVIRTMRMTQPVRILEPGPKAGGDPERYTPTVFEQVMAAAGAANAAAKAANQARDDLLAAIEIKNPDGLIGLRGPQGETGRGVASIAGNANGSWTITYTDGSTALIGSPDSAEYTITDGWEVGAFTASGNPYEGQTTRLRYPKFIKISDCISFTFHNEAWYVRYYYYAADFTFLSYTNWSKGTGAQYAMGQGVPDGAAYFKLLAYKIGSTEDLTAADVADLNPCLTMMRTASSDEAALSAAWGPGKYQYIAYSSFGGYAGNSVEFFQKCAKYRFDALKCDVRPTADGKLVCCHDAGFTMDANGRITTFNSTNCTLIRSLTYAQAMALEYDKQVDGKYGTVCDIDMFLQICKSSGIPPFITVRDEYMDEVSAALLEAVTKYGYAETAIINSSTRDSLTAVRKVLPDVTLCVFFNPFGSSMAAAYQFATRNRNTILSYYYNQSGHTWEEFTTDTTVAGYIADANALGIRQIACIESDLSHTDALIGMGFDGCLVMGWGVGTDGAADTQDIVSAVLAALPDGDGVSY